MLKILGIIFLVIIVLVAGGLIWGYLKGSGMQEDFYEAVLSGDSGRVMDMFHPTLREKVDEPLLAAWMAEFKDRMGGLKGLSKSNFSTKTSNGITTSEGRVEFEKGDVTSKLMLRDDKIVLFNVESTVPGGRWLQRLEDTGIFRERAVEFLTLLAQGEGDAARQKMHPALLEKLPEESFRQGLANLLDNAGEFRSVTFDREEFTEESGQSLVTYFRVEFANGTIAARVRFESVEFRGAIRGFQMPYNP